MVFVHAFLRAVIQRVVRRAEVYRLLDRAAGGVYPLARLTGFVLRHLVILSVLVEQPLVIPHAALRL